MSSLCSSQQTPGFSPWLLIHLISRRELSDTLLVTLRCNVAGKSPFEMLVSIGTSPKNIYTRIVYLPLSCLSTVGYIPIWLVVSTPLKIWKSIGIIISSMWKKHVPNHQPDWVVKQDPYVGLSEQRLWNRMYPMDHVGSLCSNPQAQWMSLCFNAAMNIDHGPKPVAETPRTPAKRAEEICWDTLW